MAAVRLGLTPLLALLCCWSALGAEPERLPELTYFAPAAYPAAALELGIEASVLLELDIDASGQVVDVRVLEDAPGGFGLLARETAYAFTFAPALDRRGREVSATIQYRYPFRLSDIAPLSIAGRARQAGTRLPLAGAIVEAAGPADERARTRTDVDGAFRLAGLEPGPWTLTVRGRGVVPSTIRVDVVDGAWQEVEVKALVQDADAREVDESIEVIGVLDPTPTVTHELDRELLLDLPGSFGDPVRAVQNLPGVARTPLGSGQLLVRGTGPDDSGTYLDGMRVPIAFHFAGLSTVVPAELLESVDFQPGNWGTRYGRKLGGIVDLRTSPDLPRKGRSLAAVDLFHATAFTEQPLGSQAALTLSARRSYVDTVLNPILTSTGSGAVRTPRYYDLQGRLQLHGASQAFDALFLLSDDRFRVLGDSRGATTDLIAYGTSFQKVRLRLRTELERGWRTEATVFTGPERRSLVLGDGGSSGTGGIIGLVGELPPDGAAIEDGLVTAIRGELHRAPIGGWGLRLGTDLELGRQQIVYDFGSDLEEDARISLLAAYLEPTLDVGPVLLTAGVRGEIVAVSSAPFDRVVLDPRASVKVGEGPVSVHGAVGRYAQVPPVRELMDDLSGYDLSLEASLQTSLGAAWAPASGVELQVTGYYNTLFDLIEGREGAFRFDSPGPQPPLLADAFENSGSGRVLGVESLMKVEGERDLAWLSVTVGRSLRTRTSEEEERPFGYDQPVLLTLIGRHFMAPSWHVGVRARYASGSPVTPVLDGLTSLDDHQTLPVYGSALSDRLPAFFAVDVRLDRTWTFRAWELMAYLELQNATNHTNVELAAWTPDYSEEAPVRGLPILPVFGVKGSW